MNTQRSALSALFAAGMLLCFGCGTDPVNDPEPGQPLPQGTSCSSFVIACYDEFAHQPANLICFRPTSRWNKTSLTWRLANRTGGVPSADQIDAARRAFETWASVSSLKFTQAIGAEADITITFVEHDHGDGFPLGGADETSHVLAHAFFPGSPSPGAVHMSDAESWSLDPLPGEFDLYTVFLHEIGHALGLEHSLAEGALMAPSYTADGFAQLSEADIEAIQALYGGPDGDVPPLPVTLPQNFCEPGNLLALGDPDSDGDGIPDTIEVFVLGTDPFSADSDGDGVNDFVEVFIDGTSPTTDPAAADSDGDGIPDDAEAFFGTDANNPDTDGDGLSDGFEVLFLGTSPTNVDTDGDGLIDPNDPYPTNALYGPIGPDCNENGVRDDNDIVSGTSTDANGNDIPDECEENPCDDGNACTTDAIVEGVCENTPLECNDGLFCNGVETCVDGACVAGGSPCAANQTCNETSDTCTSSTPPPDCDGDGIPDVQEPDCNLNGVPDDCDLANPQGPSEDLNENGVPDECEPLFVDDNVEGADNGSSWEHAYRDLNVAIAQAVARTETFPALPVVEIWVAEGVYTPSPDLLDRTASFSLHNRVALYGGFAGFYGNRETRRSDRALAVQASILSGDNLFNDGQAEFVAAGSVGDTGADNAYHVVTALDTDETALLDGFYIVGGRAEDAGLPGGNGGGILLAQSSARIANCTLAYNLAVDSGGGAFVFEGGKPTFENTVFVNNAAIGGQRDSGMGGGLAVLNASPRVINCTFTLNTAQIAGGGIALDVADVRDAVALILNTIVWENTAFAQEVGLERELLVSSGTPRVVANVIRDFPNTTDFNVATNPLFTNIQLCFGTQSPIDPTALQACMAGLVPAAGSPCIDSSVNDLMLDPDPPISAPETDRFGRLRVDDPSVDAPPGMGTGIIKDRGAFEHDPAEGFDGLP